MDYNELHVNAPKKKFDGNVAEYWETTGLLLNQNNIHNVQKPSLFTTIFTL